MVEKMKVNRFWKNIIEFVKENGYFFGEKKVNLTKKISVFHVEMTNSLLLSSFLPFLSKSNRFWKNITEFVKENGYFFWEKKVNLTKFCCVFHVEMTNSLLLSSFLPFLSKSK